MTRKFPAERIWKEPLTDLNIILDLDQTLIHTHNMKNQIKNLGIMTDPELVDVRKRLYVFRSDGKEIMWGIFRPHTIDFLVFCLSFFRRVIIWSAGTRDYVDNIVNHLFKDLGRRPDLVYARDECVNARDIDATKDEDLCKPLAKIMKEEPWLELTRENTFFLDDKDHTFQFNCDNAIHIPEFDIRSNKKITKKSIMKDDDSLVLLAQWFVENRGIDDVRLLRKDDIFQKEDYDQKKLTISK